MAFFVRPQSAAIKIVDPNTQDEKTTTQAVPTKKEPSAPTSPSQPTTEVRTSAIPSQAVNAPCKRTGFIISEISTNLNCRPAATPEMEYSAYEDQEQYNPYEYAGGQEADLTKQMEEMDAGFYDDSQYSTYTDYNPHALDASYYPSPPVYLRQPLDYHLYTPVPSANFVTSAFDSHFVPPSHALRQLLQKRSETTRQIAPIGSNLPEELQGYHALVPLEPTTGDRRKLGNWHSTVYRAINSTDGLPYALRRIENYRLMHQSAFSAIEIWSNIRHPSIVSVKEAFTTRSFNDNSLVFVHAYHPDAQTLFDVHLKPKPPSMQTHPYQHGRSHLQAHLPTIIPERTIWSYIVQIASAIKKVHETGQAVRNVDVTKILLTGQNRSVLTINQAIVPHSPFRVRISCCGIIDVLMHDMIQDITSLQQEDLNMFGRLIFALCCNNITATSGQNYQKSLDFISRNYSAELKEAATWFTGRVAPIRTINMFLDKISTRVVSEMEEALKYLSWPILPKCLYSRLVSGNDRLETELLSELENARLVRLLCKFGFINERPEFAREPRWSETGDRYIIKLFRDYVFHQVDEHGNPVVNLSYVLTCLNKLDAGTDEKIMLVARDEQSCLIVSYKEIKNCIQSAFGDLARAATKR
ncbi:hypothetical protein C0995_008618 [Termitomyces sp. Mi166|nr:hypothetical protein C0995_008618 [Termitomyces sp. Mi166\